MTDPAAAPLPAKEPFHLRVAGALERAFNPIMVKELRASLRGAKFFITHLTILSLFACGLLLTFAGEMSSNSGRYSDYGGDASRVGRAVYLITQLLHVAVVFLVVPGLAATSISGERERLTHELLISTTLTARQIVWGKFVAAMTQTFTIFVSMVPLVGLCFLFGGITIYQIVANYAFLFALSALVIAFALNISAGARTTQRAVGSVYGLVILGCFFTLLFVFNAFRSGFLSEVAVAYGFISRGDDFGRSYGGGLFGRVMYVHVIPGFLWASLFAFFFMNATNRLKPLFANRSTSIRAFFVVAVLGAGFLTILTCYHVFPTGELASVSRQWEIRNTDYRKVAVMVYAIAALTLSLLSALFACEDPILPPHLEAEVAGLRGIRRVLRAFWPGATSGMVFSLLFNLLFLGASFAAFVPYSKGFDWGNFQRFPPWTATALALTVVLFWSFLTAAYGRFLGITLASRPILLRTIFVLTCLFVALFPILHWAISTSLEHRRYEETLRTVDGPFTLGLSPAAAIVSLLDPSPPPHDFPAASGGIPTYAIFFVFAATMGSALVFLGNRSEKRLRAELAKLEAQGRADVKIEFTAAFLKKLEALSLVSKRLFAGRLKGERRSPRRGQSVEFADFRDYSQGDDYRHIDWNAYARLEGLFLKLFVEEEDLHIHLLLDRSRSMDFGRPNKLQFGAQVAAALAYIGLSNLDRVSLTAFSGEGLLSLPFQHGKQNVFSVLEFLQRLEPGGTTDLTRSVDAFVQQARHKGIVVVLSDFLCEDGYEAALTRLRYSKFEPIAVQILSPDEVEPPLGGDWSFLDSESGAKVDLSLGPRAVTLYKERLRSYCDGFDQFCRSRDVSSLRAVTHQDFEDLILRYFRTARVIA